MRPKVRHIALMTRNREKMVEFYQKVFGMEPKRGFGGAIYMSDGDLNIALIEIKNEGQREGLNHIGFEADDLGALKQNLKESGLSAKIEPRDDKDADYRVFDPDGMVVDIAYNRRWPK